MAMIRSAADELPHVDLVDGFAVCVAIDAPGRIGSSAPRCGGSRASASSAGK
jgi:hypothetical protein